MTNFGDLKLKEEGIAIFQKDEENLPKQYRTQFWNTIHRREDRILDKDCCEKEAIGILIEIIEHLIDGVRKGKCTYDDLSYSGQVFVNILFIYAPDLHDYFDGELYGIVEYLGSHKTNDHDDIEKITKTFSSFRRKMREYGF